MVLINKFTDGKMTAPGLLLVGSHHSHACQCYSLQHKRTGHIICSYHMQVKLPVNLQQITTEL